MKKRHLPVLGVGPIYVFTIVIVTIVGVILSIKGVIPKDECNNLILRIYYICLGFISIIIGIYLWYQAAISSKIDKNIVDNKLVTTGIYSYTRNPIYVSFMFICTGVLFFINNFYLMFLPILYYLFLTILVINTEEKWLTKKYGKKYIKYCDNVNRCLPIRKKNSK